MRTRLTHGTAVSEPLFGYFYMPVNFVANAPDEALLSQLYFRQARLSSINQPGIVQAVYHGNANPTYGPAPTVHDAYFYPYDPAKGKKLMEEHGWTMGPNG